jgi:uncharacterized repeat protein (TIGR01451 family)
MRNRNDELKHVIRLNLKNTNFKKEEAMRKKSIYIIAAMLFAAVVVAGTSITNTATVNYQVGGVPQAAVVGSTSFVVDRVVNFTVTKNADVTSAPSSTFQAIQFIVSNTSNTAMRFNLQPITKGTNTWDLGASAKIYRDNNNNAIWDAGDLQYADASTFGDIASGATFTVLIVGDIPASLPNGAASVYDLLATAVDANTLTVTTQTGGAGTMAGVDTVFADNAGSYNGATPDIARDGRHSASGTFTITAASITVSKTSAVYWDPANLFAQPKAIPGAIVEYTVTVTNTAGAAASNVTITDILNPMIAAGNIAFKTPFVDTTVITCAPGDSAISTNGGTTWACQTGTWNGGTNTLAVTVPTPINAGGSTIIKYQVTVQ